MQQEHDWNKVKQAILEMGASFTENALSSEFSGYIQELGYEMHPILVNLTAVDEIDADMGVVVTYCNKEENDGVYVFVVLRDQHHGLITLIPSTRSKAAMIRKVSGDITNAITGVDIPPLTAFDMLEITMHVLENTCMKEILVAAHISEEQKGSFLSRYFPSFLAGIAHYYNGTIDTKTGKPIVNEEIINMQPALLREQLFGKVPTGTIKQGSDVQENNSETLKSDPD